MITIKYNSEVLNIWLEQNSDLENKYQEIKKMKIKNLIICLWDIKETM